MGIFFNYNGSFFEEGHAIISAGNRSLNYGDGIFETMRVENGSIYLGDLHFERLFAGLSKLAFAIPPHFTPNFLENEVRALCDRNGANPARARLLVFPSGRGMYDDDRKPQFIIESAEAGRLHETMGAGLLTGLYRGAVKAFDSFSGFKTNNFLPYSMAALHATGTGLDDCFVLNQHGRVCDSSIANVFVVREGNIFTPPLEDGCIAGVFRKYLLQMDGLHIRERPLQVEDIMEADEVFLTNSVRGIRSVKKFDDIYYGHTITMDIIRRLEKSNV